MHTGIRPGGAGFRLWWTMICGVGAVLFVYDGYYAPGRGDVDRELTLRLYANRTLEQAADCRLAQPWLRWGEDAQHAVTSPRNAS